jgi:hypothetical protein
MFAQPAFAQPTSAAQPATQVALTVRSMNPAYAEPGRAILISGTLRNLTGSPVSGVGVRLYSSRAALTSQSALVTYARTGIPQPAAPLRAIVHVPAAIPAHASVRFTALVPAHAVATLGLSCFGVYPLTVDVTDAAGSVLASHPVPLPFWPAKPHSCRSVARPRPALINWIWPLIDVPRQGPCPGVLHDNGLAASLAGGGRLGRLLAVGARYGRTHLTWAVDPALLDNVTAMTRPYLVGGRANCSGGQHHLASSVATAWLAQLRHAIIGQTVFATPYADVDQAALFRHASMDIGLAITDGERVAAKALGLDPVPGPVPGSGSPGTGPTGRRHHGGARRPVRTGPHRLAAISWPVGGKASSALLEYLGSLKAAGSAKAGTVSQVGTVVLAMPRLAPGSLTPGAVASELTGTGANLHVLLSDTGLDRLLGSAAASSRQPGVIFGTSQLFLAETAMIIAETPSAQHSVVVAPPRRWDPVGPLAADLLDRTVAAPAPWLTPVSAGQLISSQPGHPYSAPQPQAGSAGRNANRLLSMVSSLSRRIALLQTILVNHNPALTRAVFGIESSAWRGRQRGHATAFLARMSQYLNAQFSGLSVSGSDVTLGGTVSNGVKVSVRNRLSYPVQVRLRISHSNDSVTATQKSPGPIVVDPNTTRFVLLSVHAQPGGAATLTIRLISPGGARLPVAAATMRVQATEFGTVALVIGAVALAVFVLASALRAIRHGRGGTPPPDDGGTPGELGPPAGGAGDMASADAMSDVRGPDPAEQGGGHDPAVLARRIPPRVPDETDSVVLDRSDLGPASQAELAPASHATAVLAWGGDPPQPPAGPRPGSPGDSDAPSEEKR